MQVLEEAQLFSAQKHSEELSNKLDELQSLLEEKNSLSSRLTESMENEERMQEELLQLQGKLEQSKVRFLVFKLPGSRGLSLFTFFTRHQVARPCAGA